MGFAAPNRAEPGVRTKVLYKRPQSVIRHRAEHLLPSRCRWVAHENRGLSQARARSTRSALVEDARASDDELFKAALLSALQVRYLCDRALTLTVGIR